MQLKTIITIFILGYNLILPQNIIDSKDRDIYDFLESLKFDGIINFNLESLTMQKIQIAEYLLLVEQNETKLNDTQKELLKRFLIEYEPEIKKIKKNYDVELSILSTKNKLSLFEFYSKDFSLFANPVLSFEAGSYFDKSLFIRRNGLSIGGYVLENWSYYLKFFDNEERGDNLDKTKQFTRERGVSLTTEKFNSFEYDEVTASVAYSWSNGSVSINKDYLSFGSGNFGKIILSDKAPPFPFIRFDYRPVDWLSFFYFHGFLQSNVPDSTTLRYNSVPGRTSILEVPKFIAFHSLSFYPSDKINFSLGESIVYSERIQPIYFIPIMFFRVADHYLGTGNSSATGNAQLFADFSYLNRNLKTKFYSTIFIDELSLNDIFEGGNLSSIGFTVGSESYNIFPQTKFFIEYSRVNPFVYMNSVDAQLYSNDGYKMGHWIESNADVISFGMKKFFSAKLSTDLSLWYFRKGKSELPVEQYQMPYPNFLYGSKRYEKGLEVKVYYSPLFPLLFALEYRFIDISDEENFRTPQFKIGKKSSFIIKLSYQM